MEYIVRPSTNEDIVERIFENRNIDTSKIDDFLCPDESHISSPLVYPNMELGYNLLMDCIKANGLILVLIDADADGYCSSATLINYLRLTLRYTNIKYITHIQKKHGLTKEIMNQVEQINPKLLIIPDAGSNDYRQHKELKDKGINILVIDHHEIDFYSDSAVIINNQISEECNKTLCGGGVVLKFLEYIDMKLGLNQSQFYRDLVAVSLVADGMDMTEVESRFYVLDGLTNINNPFLKELINNSNLTLNSNLYTFIGFQVSPVINAVIRMGCLQDKMNLFEAMICENRNELINIRGKGEVELPLPQYILKIANRLKVKQTKEIDRILEDEGTVIISQSYPITLLMHTNEDAQPLSGLIASKLVDLYGKPALVLRGITNSKGEVSYRGSARGTKDFPNFKDYLNGTNKFTFCEGHQSAFGVMIFSNHLRELLTDLLYQTLPKTSCHVVDKAYTDGNVSAYEICKVDELKRDWSKGFEEPKFFIRLKNVRSTDISIIGANKDTVKIVHDYITYMKFKCSAEEIEELSKVGYLDIELIGTFNLNVWRNKTTPQVFIEEYEVTGCNEFEEIDGFGNIGGFII